MLRIRDRLQFDARTRPATAGGPRVPERVAPRAYAARVSGSCGSWASSAQRAARFSPRTGPAGSRVPGRTTNSRRQRVETRPEQTLIWISARFKLATYGAKIGTMNAGQQDRARRRPASQPK